MFFNQRVDDVHLSENYIYLCDIASMNISLRGLRPNHDIQGLYNEQ